MLYLDTSALLKLYIRETGSEVVQERVAEQEHPLPIWEIQEAELTNALRLKVFWREVSEQQAEEQIVLFQNRRRRGLYFYPNIDRAELMEMFRSLSRETPRLGCRTLDILHVACAVCVGAGTFLTFDGRQGELARHAGLVVPAVAP